MFFDVPFDIARDRNKSRDRIVSVEAMEKMHSMLETAPPVIEDGFDEVSNVDTFQSL